ncbi:hypothetical protein [Rhizobium leguminosarum]|uniref:hypothetical protein n=1 Tax=Rhizobium leguminosarum TaxID=384 RepID=UPI000414AF9B|nr:hypothetical protein [Rhizobium leguminosarum]
MTAPSWTTDWQQGAEGEKSDNPIFLQALHTVKDTIFSLNRAHRVALNEQIVNACMIGIELKNDWFKWTKFIADAGWEGMKPPKDNNKHKRDAIRHVFRWICGPSAAGRKRASFYFRAVDLLLSEGVKPTNLLSRLNKPGGQLRLLAEKYAEKRREAVLNPKVISYSFAPKKVKKRWVMPVQVEFDREPAALIGLAPAEHMVFTMKGCIENLDGPHKMKVLAYSFTFDEQADGASS